MEEINDDLPVEVITAEDNTPTSSLEDPDFKYTQNLRKMFIEKLIEENEGALPTDKDGAYMLHAFLDGIDKQAVAKQRISIAKKDSQTNADMAKVLEEISRRRNSGEKIEIDITPTKEALPQRAALSGDWLPKPTLKANELAVNPAQETPDEFFKRVESENPDLLNGANLDDED